MLEKLITKLREEPVRARLYSLAVLVMGYLMTRGVVTATDVEFVLGVLGVVLAVETARKRVTPMSKLEPTEH